MQKNNRELETIVQECILMAIRESIPTESIIRAYMDESVEQEEEVIIEAIPDEPEPEKKQEDVNVENPIRAEEDIPSIVPSIKNINEENVVTTLSFNDMDSVLENDNSIRSVEAPKTIERLEEISTSRAIQRKLEEEEDDDDERLKISTETIDLSGFDLLDSSKVELLPNDFLLDGIEELH